MSSQGLHQVQKQTQTLVLAPQLRQSLKILQVPTLELRNVILEELQCNPTLEELPMDGISFDRDQADTSSDGEMGEDKVLHELEFDDSDFSILNRIREDWREQFSDESNARPYTTEDAERRQHFFDSLTSEPSLQEQLMRQAEMTDAESGTLKALEHLIGSLDDNGFLAVDLSDIALSSKLPLSDLKKAAILLKTLDPAGIGASDLRECLLIQLRQRRHDTRLAERILEGHFDLLAKRKILDIARKTGARAEEVQDAIKEISTLDPMPGRRFSADANHVVIPDVRVYEDEGEWHVHLNNEYVPRLRLSSIYKDLIAKGALNGKEKDYIQEQFRSGRFLINAIEHRQQTIERITHELIQLQEDFFRHGVARLRPLTMNQVAERVGVHETTISRAIANKFIETPHGVYDFRFFFTSGYEDGDGKAVSNTSIKDALARIIESENPSKPYSDQEIVSILKERGVKIARRTVAKYREELGILPTHLRRRYA